MPELPRRKVGIVACSGEELAEGTVTRLAALRVLEQQRPGSTVTICLPLFLAGGEGDRAFARFYPTIAVDGCELRCAARATEQYSARPAAGVVVSDLVAGRGIRLEEGGRRLGAGGEQAVDATAERIVALVDQLLGAEWDRRRRPAPEAAPTALAEETTQATCACASAIPTQDITVAGRTVPVAALPLILAQLRAAGRVPGPEVARELLDQARIYNDLPAAPDDEYLAALEHAYAEHCRREVAAR
jgi:hypothetical protein